jgi:Tol biopolymer transport system component
MKWLNGCRMRLMLVGVVAAIVFCGNSAKADFIFGEPENLGPTINSLYGEIDPCISADGLELYFHSNRPVGYGSYDLWVTRRPSPDDAWGMPVNLGRTVNSSSFNGCPYISFNGLSLFFCSNRSDGLGNTDIWVTTRPTKTEAWGPPANLGPTVNISSYDEAHPYISADGLSLYFADVIAPVDIPTHPGGYGGGDIWVSELTTGRQGTELVWGVPKNLGATVNSPAYDAAPCISSDGLMLFFHSSRTGGYGDHDIWVARRKTPDDPWEEPVNLGPPVNTSLGDGGPAISADGKTLYFFSGGTSAGEGNLDLYQAPIIPIVDLNNDGIVDEEDMCIMVDNWGTDEPLCDIGPMPWGDGIVDVQDLIVLAEHLFEEVPPSE